LPSEEHEVKHAVEPHAYAPHDEVVPAEQLPVPSQYRVGVAMPALQVAVAHAVDEPGTLRHAVVSLPSQVAVHAPVPEHAVRVPTGAPTRGKQLPGVTLHASH